MASTNKTTHYELSQYVSSDKPTYLVDYNGDMAKIDTGINTAKTTADSAATSATNAQTAAETAQTTANTAVTNAAAADTKATTANTNIGTLANLNTSAKTNLVSAINEVNTNTNNLNTTVSGLVVNNLNGNDTNKAPSVKAVKDSLVYSTSEVKTGEKWVDGKDIYKKVIVRNSALPSGVTNISHGLSNATIVMYDEYYRTASNLRKGQYSSESYAVKVDDITSTEIRISVSSAFANAFTSSYFILYYTKN